MRLQDKLKESKENHNTILAVRSLDARFDSVMIDAFEKSFSKNVKISTPAITLSAPIRLMRKQNSDLSLN